MSIGKLTVKQVLGVSSKLKGCMVFAEDHHLAYIAGHQVVVMNTETKEQSFIPATTSYQHQSQGFTAVTVSASKKMIAVAEKVDPNAIVTFYDNHSLRKKRLLTYPELGSNEIRSLSFSEDGKYLVMQGGAPEWNLVLWNVEKAAKVLCTLKMSLTDENFVNIVSFCPWDSNVILVLGKGILRLFRFIEGSLRPMAISVRKELANFISHCWLPNEQLVIGTEGGELLMLENFEIRGFINPSRNDSEEMYPALCLQATSRGFLMGSSQGEIKMFEKHEDVKEKYQLEGIYFIPGNCGNVLEFALGSDEQLIVGLSQQQLLCCSLSNLYGTLSTAANNNNTHASSSSGHAHNHNQSHKSSHEPTAGDGPDGTESAEDGADGTTAPGAARVPRVKHTANTSVGVFEHLYAPFHMCSAKGEGAITGIDIALWKSIVVTCSKDRTVRVWNPNDKRLDLIREFEEEPLGISLHPTGIYMAIAFADKIRICSILLEEIFLVREISARQVSMVKFSRGGHYLAAAIGTNLQIYNVHTGVAVATLRGHNNRIRNVLWMSFDSRIVTIGSEGLVYVWDIFPAVSKRPEHFSGSVPIFNGAGPVDGSAIYIATHDKFVKELVVGGAGAGGGSSGAGGKFDATSTLTNNANNNNNGTAAGMGNNKDGKEGGNAVNTGSAGTSSAVAAAAAAHLDKALKVTKSFELTHAVSQMIFDESRRLLLMSTSSDDGPCPVIVTLTAPALGGAGAAPVCESGNLFHSASITAMTLSSDGCAVYSGDEYGVIVISEFETISNANAAAANANNASSANAANNNKLTKQRDGVVAFEFVDEVVIHKSDLEARKGQISQLTNSVEELNKNNDHFMRLKELDHKDKLKEISEKFQTQLRAERCKYEELEAEKKSIESEFNRKVKALDIKHSEEVKAVEVKYKMKQNAEENRHKLLLQETQEAHRRWNEENEVLVSSHQKYLQELTRDYEAKLSFEQKAQREIQHEKDKLAVNFDSMRSETEADGDREVADMKIKYDAKLRQEEETAQQLILQHSQMHKSHEVLVKESTQQKIEIKRLKDKEARLFETIHTLEKDIQSHKKEIREREETITDKEKRIFDLKKKNQELEKFRFVLDYKIKELKLQIAPRENEINTMRKQIEEMNLELEQYNKSNLALNLMIDELKLKIEGIRSESNAQDERTAIAQRFMEKFCRDLQELWLLRAEQNAFKSSMVTMYRVYVQEDVSSANNDAQSAKKKDLEDPQHVYNRDREQMERSLDSLRRAMRTEALAHKRDLAKMMRESVMLTKDLNIMRKNARSLQLQRKAVEQAGDLNNITTLTNLMIVLGLSMKKSPKDLEKERAMEARERELHETAGGGGGADATGAAGAIQPSNGYSNRSRKTQPPSRSTALRTTSADGAVHRAPPAGRSPAPPGSRVPSGPEGGAGKHDQWEAWREIQIQYDTMKALEDDITAVCESLSIDPIPVIVAVDANLDS